MRVALAAAVAVVAGVTPRPTPANACSVFPGYRLWYAVPTGRTGVPTNVGVRVRYTGTYATTGIEPLIDVVLRPVGGAPVDAMVTLDVGLHALVRPTAPLAPQTTYELLTGIEDPCVSYECIGAERTLIGTFTTGDGPDDEPPVFTGLEPIADPVRYDTGANDSCGRRRGYVVDLRWTAATDDALAGYRIYQERSDGLTPIFETGTTTVNAFACAGFGPLPMGLDTALYHDGPLVVRAIDLAGNEDANTVARTFEADCAALWGASDMTASAVDTGRASVEEADDRDGGGCAVGRSPPPSWLGALVAVLVALGRRRR